MKATLLALLTTLSLSVYSDELSKTELKYQQINPELFQKYQQAHNKLNDYRGLSREFLYEAQDLLSEIISTDQEYAIAYRELSRLFIMVRQIEMAQKSLTKALEIEPNYEDGYVLQGHLYDITDQYNNAMKALIKAEELGSTSPWLHLNWSSLYRKSGEFDLMIERCQKVFDSKTKNKKAYNASLSCLFDYYNNHTKNSDKLEELYRERVRLVEEGETKDRSGAWTLSAYGHYMAFHKGDLEEGEKYVKKALDIMDYINANKELAQIYYAQWSKYLNNENHDKIKAKALLEKADKQFEKAQLPLQKFYLINIAETLSDEQVHSPVNKLKNHLFDLDSERMHKEFEERLEIKSKMKTK